MDGNRDEDIDFARLVRQERRRWQKSKLLAPHALKNFQKLADAALLELRSKYFSPADLVIELERSRDKRRRKRATQMPPRADRRRNPRTP